MSSLEPMAAGTRWKVKTLLLPGAEDGGMGVGKGISGRVWRRGARWQVPKLDGGLDRRPDCPAVPEAECLENSHLILSEPLFSQL